MLRQFVAVILVCQVVSNPEDATPWSIENFQSQQNVRQSTLNQATPNRLTTPISGIPYSSDSFPKSTMHNAPSRMDLNPNILESFGKGGDERYLNEAVKHGPSESHAKRKLPEIPEGKPGDTFVLLNGEWVNYNEHKQDHHSGHNSQHSGHNNEHSGHNNHHSGHNNYHSGHNNHHSGHNNHHSGNNMEHKNEHGHEEHHEESLEDIPEHCCEGGLMVIPSGICCGIRCGPHNTLKDRVNKCSCCRRLHRLTAGGKIRRRGINQIYDIRTVVRG